MPLAVIGASKKEGNVMSDQEKVSENVDSSSANQGSKADDSNVAPQARGVSFDNIPPLTIKVWLAAC